MENQLFEQYLREEKFQELLTLINQLIDEGNNYLPDLLVKRAIVYRRMQQWQQSVEDLSKAIELNDVHVDAYFERAVTYFHMKQRDLCLNDLDKAVELQPGNPYRYSGRAYIKASYGMIEDAIKDYEKALELDPDDAIVYNNLGLLYENMGRKDFATQYFEKADKLAGINGKNHHKAEQSKEELKIVAKYDKPSLWKMIKLLFTNRDVRKDYFRYLKNIFRIK